jgi:hypothetical protein
VAVIVAVVEGGGYGVPLVAFGRLVGVTVRGCTRVNVPTFREAPMVEAVKLIALSPLVEFTFIDISGPGTYNE